MFSIKIKSQAGNTILMMLVMIAGLSLATIAMFGSAQVYDTSGTRFVARQKALYISDGTRAFAIQLTQDFLKEFPDAKNEDVETYLNGAIPPLLPEGYSVDNIKVDMSPQGTLIIPNGTFKGMVAPQVLVKFSYTVSKGVDDAENRISHHFDAVVTLAQVGLHQFMYFVDLESAGFSPGPPTTVSGRMHANGDLCIAGGSTLTLAKVSAAGRLMHSRRPECGVNQQKLYSLSKTWIATGTGLNNPKQFGLGLADPNRNDNGCVNCLNSGSNWVDYALANWNGNAQDIAHNVPKLALPLPDDIKAQVGANGPNPYIGYSNSKNLRFLIDPVVTGDPDKVKKMKYAYNSDVRIIDGVWYVHDPLDLTKWPGKAIWSDHPGTFTDPWGNHVGQDDLKGALGWASVPKRFSYYDFDVGANSLSGSGTGTISYGNLAREVTGADIRWYPGHLINNSNNRGTTLYSGAENLCPGANPPTTDYKALSPAMAGRRMLKFDTPVTCAAGGLAPTKATGLLNATRSGINDPHVAWYSKIVFDTYPHSSTIPNDRSHILPVNVDVEHFQAALADTTPGELGSYFTHTGAKTDFNGILYVTTNWPGSLDGFSPRGAPAPWPPQNDGGFPDNKPGSVNPPRPGDQHQIRLTADEQQLSLPYQLCTKSAALINTAYDATGARYHFAIPDCDKYATGYPANATDLVAFPNAIRIHNGAKIDTTIFKKGLSIVSNMPVYVLGSYNTLSDQTGTGTPWIPTLIAGDQVTLLSDGWDDVNDPFAVFERGQVVSRPAVSTTYTVSLISGWAMHQAQSPATNEAIHSMPALIEDWSGGPKLTLNGSIALGYYPVYYRGGRYFWDKFDDIATLPYSYNYATYAAGTKAINYDKHLEMISNQPPGSPVFYTSSTQSWKIK